MMLTGGRPAAAAAAQAMSDRGAHTPSPSPPSPRLQLRVSRLSLSLSRTESQPPPPAARAPAPSPHGNPLSAAPTHPEPEDAFTIISGIVSEYARGVQPPLLPLPLSPSPPPLLVFPPRSRSLRADVALWSSGITTEACGNWSPHCFHVLADFIPFLVIFNYCTQKQLIFVN